MLLPLPMQSVVAMETGAQHHLRVSILMKVVQKLLPPCVRLPFTSRRRVRPTTSTPRPSFPCPTIINLRIAGMAVPSSWICRPARRGKSACLLVTGTGGSSPTSATEAFASSFNFLRIPAMEINAAKSGRVARLSIAGGEEGLPTSSRSRLACQNESQEGRRLHPSFVH